MKHHVMTVCLLLVGCGGTGRTTPSNRAETTLPTVRAVANDETSAYYAGTSDMYIDARQIGQTKSLVKRTLSPTSATITEEVIAEDPERPGKSKTFIVTMRVTGSEFLMTEQSGAFSGKGSLVGPPWAWTSWQSIAELPDGGTVTSDDTLTTTGMSAVKQYTGHGMRMKFVETYNTIDRAQFEQRKRQLLAP